MSILSRRLTSRSIDEEAEGNGVEEEVAAGEKEAVDKGEVVGTMDEANGLG